MVQFCNKLFNIRTKEWPLVLLLFLIAVLTNLSAIWGSTIIYAAFLKQVGIASLPWILVWSSVCSIFAIALYSAFVDRAANATLLIALYLIGTLTIVAGVVLLWANFPLIAYPLLYLLFLTWVAVFNPHFITYVNGFYDVQSVKRILPLVAAGFRVGAIFAGLTMPFVTHLFTPTQIIAFWSLTYILISLVLWFMPSFLKNISPQSDQPEHVSGLIEKTADHPKRFSSYVKNMQEGFRYTLQSPYLRCMAIGTLALMVLMAFLEYASSKLLLESLGTQEKLASFLAALTGTGNVVVLLTLLFVISRIIAHLGLGNAALLFPVGNLIVCGCLIVIPGLASAAIAYLDRTAFRNIFQGTVDGLLYNAVPLRIKGRVRAFATGLIIPIGGLIGGLLLLVPFISATPWVVPTLIAALAIMYLLNALTIRRQYSQALIKMLEQEDYSFLLLQEVSDMSINDSSMLIRLQKKLEESANEEFTIFMAQLLVQVGGKDAIPMLEQIVRTSTNAHTRTAILDVLMAADVRSDDVRQLYINCLTDADAQVRESAFAGVQTQNFASQLSAGDPEFQALALRILSDPDITVRIRALSALAKAPNFYELSSAVEALNQLLNDPASQRRAQAVGVLGQTCAGKNTPVVLPRLVEYLADPADEVRLEAALVIEKISAIPSADSSSPQIDNTVIITRMRDVLHDPVERIRQAAIAILGRNGQHAEYELLINALKDNSPQIRAAIIDTLVRIGRSIIPLIHPLLYAPDSQLRKMTTIVLSRINPREFGALIGSHITDNLLNIYRNYGYLEALTPCIGYLSLPILQCTLREKNQQWLDEIFYLLTAIHDAAGVRVITDSLRQSDARIRSNALEALESLTTPQTASLIAPLFERDVALAQLLALSKEVWDMKHPNTMQTIEKLAAEPGDEWIRMLTLFVLGEISAVTASKIKQSIVRQAPHETPVTPAATDDASSRRRHSGRRGAPADLLGKLSDTEPQPPPPENPQPSSESQTLFDLPEVEAIVDIALTTGMADDIQHVMKSARRMIMMKESFSFPKEENIVLSAIEKIIFLKEVPFFHGMTIDQLRILAQVCEEQFFEEDTRIFNANDSGGILYVVVNGRVGIEQEKRKGSFVRLATIEAHSYFGEMNLFDNSPRSTSAIALQDTLTLCLRREPVIVLARQYPDLSLELIKVLSQRLRETNDRIGELTKSRPRELHKLFDQLDETT